MGNSNEVFCIKKESDNRFVPIFVDKEERENNKKGYIEYYGCNELVHNISNSKDISNLLLKLNKFSGIEIPQDINTVKYKEILDQVRKNNREIMALTEEQYYWLNFDAKIMDKLAIGLGGQSVFENDITLHHIYGIPYIPGQAIKGSMRNYIIREEKEFNGDEIKAVKNYFFRCIFGSGSDDENADQGKVIFLDAYPNDKFDLEKDVITTHYTNYYQGSGFPLDTEEPIPNNFLIVKDTCFSFNIGISRKVADENCTLSNGKSVRAFLLETILDVLQYNGLGAKTSVGYGFFDVDRKQIIADEKAKWEEEKRRLEAETEKKKFEEETKGMTELRIEMYKLKKMTGSTKHNEVMNLFKEYIDKVDGDEKIELAEFIKNYLVSENKWNKKNGDKLNKKIERICDILNCEI